VNGVSQPDWLTRTTKGRWPIALELEKRNLMSSVALIGHRIAHGGDLFSESTLITKR
jgi:acetate kinase